MTQSIELKEFNGGTNNIASPFLLFPNEGVYMKNVCCNGKHMVTKNYILDAQVVPPKASPTDPLQIAPQGTYTYDMTTSLEDYYEKVRFYQGEDYVLINGIPTRLKDGVASSVLVTNTVDNTTAVQATLPIPDLNYTTVEKYTYFISYRNSAGFESPLEEIGTVYAHRTFDTTYTTETASEQTIQINNGPPAVGDYCRIYRMGGNISFPSLVFQFDSSWNITLNLANVTYTATGNFKFRFLDDDLGIYGETWGGVYPPYLSYMTATKFGLAAANGSQVYLSMNKPDAWSALNMLNFGSKIVGIASVYRGFLVFTESTYLYLVSGASLSTLRIDLISTDVGCSSNSSIAEVGQHALVWIYKRRMFMFNGSTVNELEANTYDYQFFHRQGGDKDITAVSYEGQYLASTEEGMVVTPLMTQYKPFIEYQLETTLLVENEASYIREFLYEHDRRIGAYKPDGSFWALKEYTYGDETYIDEYPELVDFALGAYTNPPTAEVDNSVCVYPGEYGGLDDPALPTDPCTDSGVLIGNYTNGNVIATPILYRGHYKGPKLAFNAQTTQCKFNLVEILYEGELIVHVYIDEILVAQKEVISSDMTTARVHIPSELVRGNYIQVGLYFNGKIFSYRVDGEPENPV